MKSSTSHRAGISRTLRYTTYFTIGANVSTSRSRNAASPVRLYSRHSQRILRRQPSAALLQCQLTHMSIRSCGYLVADAVLTTR